MRAIEQPARKRAKQPPSRWAVLNHWSQQALHILVGVGRLCTPSARGVYHPQSWSPVVLGVALPAGTDVDVLERRLWWRGLGLIERDGRVIAGADITAAVQQRRVRQARAFVTRQLRDAGVRGQVARWELRRR
ncbi:MAG TPA: hypothetical protein VFZ66_01625 [Herpetosiphonaceae bacterium]